ncbi:MAG TPA: 16S rRNA (guanine(966)-N(2))-methyltransferase RsmD, partial [Clostridia bacterium]|nr:16S rRNA (guanine(966)-N(2))-methyltransferase RsmD [Clostridia bacterium]
MIRIISGVFRGRKLKTPPGDKIRPTSDRVKESLFNILQNDLGGSRVLDLFAGTGSLGLEALSRGASFAVFVDNDPTNGQLLHDNIDKLAGDRARIYIMDFARAIEQMASRGVKFDIVFVDPPYLMNLYKKALDLLFESRILNASAIVVLEQPQNMTIQKTQNSEAYARRKY